MLKIFVNIMAIVSLLMGILVIFGGMVLCQTQLVLLGCVLVSGGSIVIVVEIIHWLFNNVIKL